MGDGLEPRRVVVQSAGGVMRAGDVAEVFGGANRAILCVEQDGVPVEELLLLRVRHHVVAVVNHCPHMGRSLDDARVHGSALCCRGHGRCYSLRTGRALGTIAVQGQPMLRRVPAWTVDGQLLLDLTALTLT
jgi:nitrite reductase/ring-hydroxylating ferredoxin subunit